MAQARTPQADPEAILLTPAEIRVNFKRIVALKQYENETYELGLTETRLFPEDPPEVRRKAILSAEGQALADLAAAVDQVMGRRGRSTD